MAFMAWNSAFLVCLNFTFIFVFYCMKTYHNKSDHYTLELNVTPKYASHTLVYKKVRNFNKHDAIT